MRKRYAWLIISAILLFTIGVGVTVALLVSSSNTVVNTFTIGDLNISLGETTGDTYIMTPGVGVPKDPVVTVIANSESCWLFVKIEKSANFDDFCSYELQSGWTEFSSAEGIYCRQVSKSSVDLVFHLLKNDRVLVKDSVTEEQLNALTSHPTLNFTAYAIQSESVATAQEAWTLLNQ